MTRSRPAMTRPRSAMTGLRSALRNGRDRYAPQTSTHHNRHPVQFLLSRMHPRSRLGCHEIRRCLADIIQVIKLLTHHLMSIRYGSHAIELRVRSMQTRQSTTFRIRAFLLGCSTWLCRVLDGLLEVRNLWRSTTWHRRTVLFPPCVWRSASSCGFFSSLLRLLQFDLFRSRMKRRRIKANVPCRRDNRCRRSAHSLLLPFRLIRYERNPRVRFGVHNPSSTLRPQHRRHTRHPQPQL
jgi:hypothetical protein